MLRDRQGSTGLCGPFAYIIGEAHANDHNTVETGPPRRTAVYFKALFGLAAVLALSFGCSVAAQAREAKWDGTAVWRDMEERQQYILISDPAIPSITESLHLKRENFDWNTYQDLRTKGQMPRYMMRPPIGIFDQKGTP
jgi:hypothetical protein